MSNNKTFMYPNTSIGVENKWSEWNLRCVASSKRIFLRSRISGRYPLVWDVSTIHIYRADMKMIQYTSWYRGSIQALRHTTQTFGGGQLHCPPILSNILGHQEY